MTIVKRLVRLASAACRSREGVSSVEFALAAPLLAGLLALLVDFGIGFYDKMQVDDAAQAGAQYAVVHGWDSTAIQNAVTNATPLSGISASPAPTQTCGCPNGTGVTTASCGATCTNGQTAGTYVTVSSQATYTPMLSYPIFGSTITLTGQSVARIQ